MKRALVTGGARGIGAAVAGRLRADGYDVITADVIAGADVELDVTRADQVASVLAEIGPVQVLVNSAGVVGPNKPLSGTTEQEWASVFDVNVFGLVSVTRGVLPSMVEEGWGRIVNLASMAGKDGNPNLSIYSASKAAVIALTKALAKETATTGVLVNTVAPAVICTPMNAETAPEVLERLTSLIPMGRLGQPEEAAALVSWLCSDECSFSTGAVYDLSGGRATY